MELLGYYVCNEVPGTFIMYCLYILSSRTRYILLSRFRQKRYLSRVEMFLVLCIPLHAASSDAKARIQVF